jgi:hypothetical protein
MRQDFQTAETVVFIGYDTPVAVLLAENNNFAFAASPSVTGARQVCETWKEPFVENNLIQIKNGEKPQFL